MKKLLLSATLLTSCAVPAALAAAPTEPASLDPIVVTATRGEQPASEALAPVIVITRDDIERAQATDIAELLRFHAGVEIARNGGPGQVTSVFVRGGESNHTLLLIDGVRMNPATAGGAALQNIAPDTIERIEIVKGPRATLYGSDAIAAVINVITRRGEAGGANLAVRAGSDRLREIGGSASAASGAHELSLQAQRSTSDGLPSCASATLDRGYDRTTVQARAATAWQEKKLEARLWSAQGNTEYLDFCNPAFGNNPLDQDFTNRVAEVAFSTAVGTAGSWQTRVSASHMVDDIEQQQANFLGQFDYVRTARPRLDWHNTIALGDAHRLGFGLEAARESVDALSFGSVASEDRELLSAFVQDEWTRGRHRLLGALAFTDHDAFGSELTWNAAYGIDLFQATRLSAAAGTGFRAPDATDRFGFGGNPDLEPEEARNLELGLRQRLGEVHVFDLRLFASAVDNLISVECDPTFTRCLAQNVDEYRNEGLELSWRAGFAHWDFSASAIRQDPRSENRPDPCSGEARLCRRAEQSAAASAVWHLAAHQLGVDLLASGERVDFGGAKLPGYALLNLTGRLRLDRHWQLQARVENLLDTDYQTAAGFNQPGASVFVSLRFSTR